jgi:hypothetical protein
MPTWARIVIIVAVIVVAAAVAYTTWRKRRTTRLQEGYGPEYARALADAPSRREAEADLLEREQRHEELELKPLARETRARYLREWEAVQARFVDDPEGAIGDADGLIQQVMAERGYPIEDFEQRAADLSVEHGGVVEHYRAAHVISRRSIHGEASTEDQRQAIVHYRALFEDLLETEPRRVEST